MQKFEQTITKQGTPLFVFPMPHVQSVAAGVLVFAGSRDEVWPKEAGIAHALEHMLFQGNERLGSSAAIAGEIERCGGVINARTASEMTFHYRVVPSDAFGVAVASLASQVAMPLLRSSDIAKEMQNVVQECRMYHDMPDAFCSIQFEYAVHGEHPLGKFVLGTEEAILAFDRDDFHRFWNSFYRPENYIFLAVGNTTLPEAETSFSGRDFGAPTTLGRNTRARESGVATGIRRINERDIQQAHVCLGTSIGASDNPDTKALSLFKTMLSGGASFPLFQEVRQKLGLCYHIRADVDTWSDRGVFQIYIGTDPVRIGEAIERIHGVIRESAQDEGLFEKARTFLLGRNAVNFVDPQKILERAYLDVVFEGTPKTPDEIRVELEAQTFEGVHAAVERWLLDQSRYSYSYVVPVGTKI